MWSSTPLLVDLPTSPHCRADQQPKRVATRPTKRCCRGHRHTHVPLLKDLWAGASGPGAGRDKARTPHQWLSSTAGAADLSTTGTDEEGQPLWPTKCPACTKEPRAFQTEPRGRPKESWTPYKWSHCRESPTLVHTRTPLSERQCGTLPQTERVPGNRGHPWRRYSWRNHPLPTCPQIQAVL